MLLTALTSFIPVAHAQSPTTIDFPGGLLQGSSGINNRGQIVGSYIDAPGGNFHGYLYEGGAFSPINVPNGLPSGISDNGQIVGSYGLAAGGFLDNGGVVTRIVDPSANVIGVSGISSNGAYVVGNTSTSPGSLLSSDGFLYTGGVFTTIDAPGFVGYTGAHGVNNSGQIVGSAAYHGFLDNGGVFTFLDVPGAASTEANGINDNGTIVGSYANVINTSTRTHGFVYNGGIFTSFDFPGATSTTASGINDNGDIVGTYTDAAGNYHGFLYPGGAQGYLNPRYLIMGVTYAPPGGSASSVSYQTTNVVGNTSTITASFTNSASIGVSVSAEIKAVIDGKLTAIVSSGWTQKATTSNAVTVTKTSSTTFKTPGVPNVYSPVNHDYDIIWLWLNPAAVFTLSNPQIGGPVVWNGYGYDLNDPLQDVDVWPVYVGYLNGDFGPLDPQDAGALSRSWVKTQMFGPGQGPGITSSDYPNILKADPFAYNPYDANSGFILTLAPGTNPATSTDGRYTAAIVGSGTPQSVPYPQAPPNSAQGIQTTYQSAYQTQSHVTQATTSTYMVGFGLELKNDASFFGLFGAGGDLKSSWSLTWDNTSQIQNTNTNTQTDTAVIASPPCPATTAPCNPQYTEPHAFAVYQDNLYGTFMFWPNPYFSISKVAPATSTVAAGGAVSYTISTLANSGYSGTSISFSVTGLPAGASFMPGTVAPGNSFALVVSTSSVTPTGGYPLTISATDGPQSYFAYATLVVTSATPSLSSLSPNSAAAGGPAFTLTANGSGFLPGANILWNGSALSTKYMSGSQLSASVPGSLIASQGSASVTVQNPSGAASNALTFTINPASGAVAMILSQSTLYFAGSGATITDPQTVSVSFSGGALRWTASSSQSNVMVSPASGTGLGFLQITATAGPSAVVTVTAPGATNSPQRIQVNIANVAPGVPYGSFDTPVNNTTGITGSIAVTGWALDAIEITKVDIWREPVPGEPPQANGLVYIGDVVFVVGSRPDVEGDFPNVPLNDRAGWGYLMLTTGLPNNGGSPGPGNGTYRLHAIAHNKTGASVDLGTRTITVDNAHGVKPFGAIDTPGQGGTISGTAFVNFGWVLTPQPCSVPIDGSTIWVGIDGQLLGHPVYNNYRSDIANGFPGYANSNGAVGYFYLDTTQFTNGIHSIGWLATDSCGRTDGMGSRFITVAN